LRRSPNPTRETFGKAQEQPQPRIDEIISQVRAEVTKEEPAVDIDFTQVLQDMIGDLTGAPQPIVVKLFSPDADLLATWAPRVADSLGRVYVGGKSRWSTSRTALKTLLAALPWFFTVNPGTASRAGFTTDQLTTAASAIVDGEPATTPVIIDDRPYTLRVRFPQTNRSSLEAMSNTLLVNSTGGTATLGSMASVIELPGQTEILRENLQRDVEVTARLEGLDLGGGVAAVQEGRHDLKLPPSIRVEYGGTYREQQKSFHDLIVVLLLALVLIFLVAAVRVPVVLGAVAILSSAVLSTSGVFLGLLITRTTFNVSSFMGLIMVIGIVAKNGILLLDANQKFRSVGFSAEEALIQAGAGVFVPS